MKLFWLYSVIIDKSFWTVEIITVNYVPTAVACTAQNQCFCASHTNTAGLVGGKVVGVCMCNVKGKEGLY
jgi:hypothetical protein